MRNYEPFIGLIVALAAGFLVGMQREQAALAEGGREDRSFVGGIRTYPLYSLAGALSTLIARQAGVWLIGVVFIAQTIPLAMAYYDDVRKERDRGLTSELAFIITFLMGVLAMSEGILDPPGTKYLIVAATAVTMTGLLSLKQPLHHLAAKATIDDIYSTLKFLILAVIILPLLPNENMGPLKVLNPFYIGLMIVLMAGLGFVGYLAIRVLGAGRGLALTGLIGGLVSSTVVTLAVSARARREPAAADACVLAVVLASTIMLIRMLILVSAVYAPLLNSVSIPLGAMLAAGFVSAVLLYREGSAATSQDVKFTNPFELGLALKFGLVFSIVMLASTAAQTYLGNRGIYATAMLAGTTDVDAITLSMANLSKKGLEKEVATTAILLACASNTAVKAGLAATLGGWAFGRKVILIFAFMLLAGALGALAVWY